MTTTTVVEEPRTELRNLKQEIDEFDRHGYVFGQHLAQSKSPFLHSLIYQELGLNWGQVRLDSDDLDLFLKLIKHPKFYGASVTMPHKISILPHLDSLTEECRAVGACNTVFLRPDPSGRRRRRLCGANTDVIGIREAFAQNVGSPATVFHDRPALVIGGGGAARSAVYALRHWLRAGDIYVVNRDDAEVAAVMTGCAERGFGERLRHVRTVEEAAALEAPGAVVACVPDLPPRTDEEVLARQVVREFLERDGARRGALLEMCYNPTPYTELGAIAEKAGWQVILGTEALIWQGIEQDKYWTGRTLEPSTVRVVQDAMAKILPGQ